MQPLKPHAHGTLHSSLNAERRQVRDHSNGDMASPLHCWRIRLQAPPTMVTNFLRSATPFSDTYPLLNWRGHTLSAQVERTHSLCLLTWLPPAVPFGCHP